MATITQRCWLLYFKKFSRDPFSLAAGALACATMSYIIYMKISTQSGNVIPPLSANYTNLVEAITARASHDRYIVLAMVDESFTDMAINLYETSLRPNNINNYLFVGVGIATCGILHRQSLACIHYTNVPRSDKPSDWSTAAFNRKVIIKSDMIWEALSANFTVLLTDVDVIILDNPFDEIKVKGWSQHTCIYELNVSNVFCHYAYCYVRRIVA